MRHLKFDCYKSYNVGFSSNFLQQEQEFVSSSIFSLHFWMHLRCTVQMQREPSSFALMQEVTENVI